MNNVTQYSISWREKKKSSVLGQKTMSFFSFHMGIRQADYFVEEVFSHSEIW